MPYTAQELLKLASDYDNVATRALVVTAKKKEKKKVDPKAKLSDKNKRDKKIKKKKSSEYYDAILNKFAQQVSYSVGLSNTDKQRLMGLVSALAGNNGPLSKELSDAFGRLAAQRTDQNGSSYFIPENVQQFLPVLDKVKVALNQARPNGPEYNTAAELYDIFKRMSVTSAPTSTPKGGLPVREDVTAAQNQLYRANPEFAKRLEQSGGVDGKLGKVTIQLLREYLPFYETEDAVKYLAGEEKKDHAPKEEPEQLPPNPYDKDRTWGG